jgi:hypothetical protein
MSPDDKLDCDFVGNRCLVGGVSGSTATVLAQVDATVLIARYGVRASYIANGRAATMRNGSMFVSNRPPCHWKRVHSITRQLLPYDGDDGAMP